MNESSAARVGCHCPHDGVNCPHCGKASIFSETVEDAKRAVDHMDRCHRAAVGSDRG